MEENVEFKGATLQMNMSPGSDGADQLNRNRPFNASTKSSSSNGSATNVAPQVYTPDFVLGTMFSYRPGAFENAMDQCQKQVLLNDVDGEVKGAWLLTEIDHWDHEHERMVILTEYSLLIVRYDFIAIKLKDFKRIGLHLVDKIQIGDLVYPEKSLMPKRQYGGIRVIWNHGKEPTLAQKWNPFSREMPYDTFTHHPLRFNEKEQETRTYNVDDLYNSIVQGVTTAYRSKRPGEALRTEEIPIVIESYANLASVVFNQSHIGFNRERGGVSF